MLERTIAQSHGDHGRHGASSRASRRAPPKPPTRVPTGASRSTGSDENGFAQLWTANPDLTAEQQLTHGDANSGWPAWAPDASRIAFDSDRSDPDPTDQVFVNDVFTMRPDGTDVQEADRLRRLQWRPGVLAGRSLVAFDAQPRAGQRRARMAARVARSQHLRRARRRHRDARVTDPASRDQRHRATLLTRRHEARVHPLPGWALLRVRSSGRRHVRRVHRQPRRHRAPNGSPAGA